MSRPTKPIALVDKIAQAFAAVERLQRNGSHPRGFRYTRAHDVFEIIRSKLLSRGANTSQWLRVIARDNVTHVINLSMVRSIREVTA